MHTRQQQPKTHTPPTTRPTPHRPHHQIGHARPELDTPPGDLPHSMWVLMEITATLTITAGIILLIINIPRETGVTGTIIFAVALTTTVTAWTHKGQQQ